jgi:hypothetical protein
MLAKKVKDVTIFTDSLYKRKQVLGDGDRKEVATAEDKDTSGVINHE